MKDNNHLSRSTAWQMLLCGKTIAAYRLTEAAVCYLRNQAQRLGRNLVGSGSGIYQMYSLND